MRMNYTLLPGGVADEYKTLIDEDTVGAVKTTYIGRAYYLSSGAPLTSVAAWSIKKIVETTTGTDVDTVTFLPVTSASNPNNVFEFIWDNRAVLTYS